jgi:predicted nucleic acid-binding Zn ribbon protein
MTSAQGPIHPQDHADQVPPERLAELVRERRRWLWSEGYGLFQLLDRIAEEAPLLAEVLGYADADALLKDGYGLDLVLGERAQRWLPLLLQERPAEPVLRQCACCGAPFKARRQDARYCSSTCRSRISRSRRRLRAENHGVSVTALDPQIGG